LQNTFVNPASAAILLPVLSPISGTHSEDNVSPEATLTWHPGSNTTLYGAYKTGYLSGGFSNPGILSRSVTLQNDTFDPEKVRGGEVGAKWALLGNRLGGDLVLFEYHYEGLPLSTFDAQSVTFVTRNAASTVTRGVEFQTRYDFGAGWSAHGGVSYNEARFKDFKNGQCYIAQTVAAGCIPVTPGSAARSQDLSGKRVYRAPDWLANAGAQYQFPIAGDFQVGLSADVQYTSSYYVNLNLNPGSLQDSFVLVNASARLTTPSGRWTVAVIGRNLTNEIYATLGTDKPGGLGEVLTVAGAPRAALLQVSGKF
jgi:outer membrane receptor protein involved in Fe transport